VALSVLAAGTLLARAEGFPLSLEAAVAPSAVLAGQPITYTITLRNTITDISAVSLEHLLPPGFTYVAGSTQILHNDTLVARTDPTVLTNTLTWPALTAPAARGTSHYGMHTFVQDRCEKDYYKMQLEHAREAMGPGSFVKQLFYGITTQTSGPQSCWVDFVNACYDRDLIPVVRLQGEHGGSGWNKPPATAPDDYTDIAAAYARVVSGLPRRDGRLLYIEVWNEPNLDSEWGGAANPEEYGHFLVDVSAAIRALGDPRIRVLNGALSPGGNYAFLGFIDAMAQAVPESMQAFDVWATHPYPGNHPPQYNIHQGAAPSYPEVTIDSYLLELQRLANNGRRNVSVLLTETGYALGRNDFAFQGYPPIDESNRADYIVRGLRDYWSQWPEVLGVCPFELVDPYGGWEAWDWLYRDTRHRPQYDAVAGFAKTPVLAQGKLVLRFRARAGSVQGLHTSRIHIQVGADSLTLYNAVPVQVIVPTPTPTLTPSLTPTVTATAPHTTTLTTTPTVEVSPSPTATEQVSATATATLEASPTSTSSPTEATVKPSPSPTETLPPSPTAVITDRVWLPMVLSGATESGEAGSAVPAVEQLLSVPRASGGVIQLALPAPLETGAIRALTLDGRRQRVLVAIEDQMLALDMSTGTVLATARLPGWAEALAVDDTSGQVYAALPERGEVVAISLSGVIRGRATGLGRPTRLVIGGSRLYVSDSLQRRVIVLSLACDIINQRTLPAAPYALALDWNRRRLYVGQMGNGTILALDAETLASESTLALGGLGYPLDLALDSSGEILYVAHALSPKFGALSVIKTGDMSILRTLWGTAQRALTNADSVRWDARHNVVLLGVAEGIMALDGRTLEVVHLQSLSRAGWPGTMEIDPSQGTVFLTGEESHLWSWQGDSSLTR
jgi:uncharacterized repeat protein (TIGR01451 family)